MQRLSRELHGALAARVPVRAALWSGSQAGLPLFATLAALRAATWLASSGPIRGDTCDTCDTCDTFPRVSPRPRERSPHIAASLSPHVILSAAKDPPRTGTHPRAASPPSRRTDEVVLAGDAVLAPLGLALGRAFGRPVAAVAHGLDVVYPNPLHQALVLPALKRVDLVLAISSHVRDLVIARGVAPERCVAIPLAVEPEPLPTREEARARLGRALGTDLGSRPLVMWIGRMVPRKGVVWLARDVLPRVLARRPEALCLIAGDGPERAEVESVVRDLPIGGARVMGRVDDATRADLWAASDLFVMPNQPLAGDAEGFGLVAAEAAHAGLPTVATDLEGIADAVVDGATGRLVPPGDAGRFADVVVELLDAPAQRARLSASARAEAGRRFSWDVVGDRYAAALASLL